METLKQAQAVLPLNTTGKRAPVQLTVIGLNGTPTTYAQGQLLPAITPEIQNAYLSTLQGGQQLQMVQHMNYLAGGPNGITAAEFASKKMELSNGTTLTMENPENPVIVNGKIQVTVNGTNPVLMGAMSEATAGSMKPSTVNNETFLTIQHDAAGNLKAFEQSSPAPSNKARPCTHP